jgi:hypothetical protein
VPSGGAMSEDVTVDRCPCCGHPFRPVVIRPGDVLRITHSGMVATTWRLKRDGRFEEVDEDE